MNGSAVVLHKGKDKSVRNRHHWIFSGAVKCLPDFENGNILSVESAEGEFLGYAYFNKKCSIIGRMISFDRTPPQEALERNIAQAIALRGAFHDDATSAYRIVNGEGDGIPGLIVDRYKDVLVLQVSTLGMEKLKPFILEVLGRLVPSRSVYEKSNVPSRREEGLPMVERPLGGEPVGLVEFVENGLHFLVDIVQSQKTGFYLDQREMRKLVRALAEGRRVFNAFSYTGAFSVYALAGGAASVTSVDTSEHAIALARENCRINGFVPEENPFHVADVFDFIRESDLNYDFIILDPPSFAKRKAEVVRACRGYKDMHRIVFQKIPSRSLVLTFSCSFFVDEALFQQVVFQAAREASRNVRLLQRHHHAYDHPVNIYHPEGDYLKGFLLYVE